MKTRVIPWILLLIFTAGALFSYQMPTKGKVTATALNIRTGPSTSYQSLGTLPNGTIVDIVDVSGSWYKVNTGSYSGRFVHSGYIDVLEYTEVNDEEAAKKPYATLRSTDPKKQGKTNTDTRSLPRSDF